MRTIVMMAVLLAAARWLPGQPAPGSVQQTTRTVDWAGGVVRVEITRALDPSVPSLVKAKADAETDLDQRSGQLLLEAIGPLPVDSSHLVSEEAAGDPEIARRLVEVVRHATRTELFLKPDFSALVARYSVPFFGDQGIGTPFFPSRSTPIRRRLGDVATRVYTGLLIFARGSLPAVGTSGTATANPALFPRIWDEQMNLVLDRTMCSPEALARWGMVGYSQSVDDPAMDLRVGSFPLRLAARGVFGDHATDVVISLNGARQLLALPQNIALLQQGRIVIVYERLETP